MPGALGKYDIAKIVGWAFTEGLLDVTAPTDEGQDESPRNRLDRLRGDEVELSLAAERGHVVDVDPARRLITRRVNEAKALLEQLPDRFAAELPEEADADMRAKVRKVTQEQLDEVFLLMSELPKSSPFNPLDEEATSE